MSSLLVRLTAGLFFVALVVSVTVTAAPAPVSKEEPKTDKATTPEKIRHALDRTGSFEFQDGNNTLTGVLKTLSEHYRIPIVLDKTVLAQMGIDGEGLNVQIGMKDVKLRTALRAMISEYNLTMTILSDCLLITTEEMAVYRQLKQRINLDCEDVPLNKILKDLSTRYGVNIVLDPKAIKSKSVETKVSLQIDDVPLEAGVRLLCEMADLKPARMGNVILVTTEARADKLKDSNSLVPPPTTPLMPGGPLGMLGGGFAGGGAAQVFPVPQAVPAVGAADLPANPPAEIPPPPPAVEKK